MTSGHYNQDTVISYSDYNYYYHYAAASYYEASHKYNQNAASVDYEHNGFDNHTTYNES